MKTVIFKSHHGEHIVTRDQILAAMTKFDQTYRGTKERDTGRGWFIQEDGKRYPPKLVVSLATGVARGDFYSGERLNKILRELGFDVREIDDDATDVSEIEPAVEEAIRTTFGIERDLQAALRSQIEQLERGLKITDGGNEKQVPSGRIDITAEDGRGTTVVIELKAGMADRDAIGQILGYMGDMVPDKDHPVRGVLVAGDFSARAKAAASMVPNLQLKKYGFNFAFELVSLAIPS